MFTRDELTRIADEQDRSASNALLGQLRDPALPEDQRAAIADALVRVADPRSVSELGKPGGGSVSGRRARQTARGQTQLRGPPVPARQPVRTCCAAHEYTTRHPWQHRDPRCGHSG